MLQSLNLNLLPLLERLLATGSVTVTARETGLDPSVVSRGLEKLRRHLGDPLLVRAGGRLVPTPRALALAPELEAALGELRRALHPARGDSAAARATTRRVFTVSCDDATAELLAGPVHAEFAREAPLAALHFLPEAAPDPRWAREGRVDLELGAGRRFAPETRVRTLGREPLVGLVREGHALARRGARADAAAWARWPHALATAQLPFAEELTEALRRKGPERHVALVLPSFHALGRVVAGGDLVAVLPRALAQRLAEVHGGVLLKPPVPLAPVALQLGWHPRFEADPEHIWLRALLPQVLAGLRRSESGRGGA